jgi:hypothetical protein
MPKGIKIAAAAVVFTLAFIVYLLTLAPAVTFVDSGELIVASAGLGVAHPPGFPLYMLLSHLATLLPVGSVAVRVHAASALFAALAAAMMTLLVVEIMLTPPVAPKNTKTKDKEPTVEPKMAHVIGPAVMAGLLFAFSRTLWAYATIAEVYTLNSLLIVTTLWLVFSWRREFASGSASYRKLYIAALVFGLGLGVHHVTVAFFLPSLAVVVLTTAGRRFLASRHFLFAALFAIAGLSVYAYLPLAASQSPTLNWGEPSTLEAVWRHVSGQQYQSFFSFEPERLLDLTRFLSREWGLIWVPATLALALAGFIDRFRRERAMAAFLAIVICIDVLYCIVYAIAEDRDAYYLPTFIALTIAAAYGARWLMGLVKETPTSLITPAHVAAALFVLPIIAFASNLPYNNRHRFYAARDYVSNIYGSVEPGGMVLTTDWQVYSPSLYVREIEGQRKDIVFIDTNLLRRSWYYGYLDKAYPEAMARSRAEVEAFRQELRAWDRDPAAYERSPTLNQRINKRFQDMLVSLVTEQLKAAPLYITSELAEPAAAKEFEAIKQARERYDIVPQGLVFRLVERGSTAVVMPPEIEIRGLNDGTVRYDSDDIVRLSVIPVYTRMLANTGLYLVTKGVNDRAERYFRQALAIDPTSELAKSGLAASQGRSSGF